jgi:hypothetical protein
MNTHSKRNATIATTRFAVRAGAALACLALGTGLASAECTQRQHVAGKCPPPPHATAKSTFAGHVAGTTPFGAKKAQPVTKMRRSGPPPGPSPIEHSDKNALNPQPIPPGHPVHPLPPLGQTHEGGGH